MDAPPGVHGEDGGMICRTPFHRAGAAIAALCATWMVTAGAAAAPSLVPVVSGLESPLFVTSARDGSERLFIVEQDGTIKVLRPGAAAPTVFLDIEDRVLSGGERGLLGLAFHPRFASNRRFIVNYTRQPDSATVIAEYLVSAADPDVADRAERVLLVIPQPFPNHKGGMVEFGPDGFLYIGLGDGGSANDPDNRAQDVSQLLGKILRINVDTEAGGLPYSSPPDNPFAGPAPGRDEIYALGLRNPFRFSFDRTTGALYAADVGQDAVEEIDIIVRGGNYGWRIWEGTRCTGLDPARCDRASFVFPVDEYGRTAPRCSVIGGYVYRGPRSSLPQATYVYADFCSGEVFGRREGTSSILLQTGLQISSFGEDEAGELYIVDLDGAVYRLAASCGPGQAADAACTQLAVSTGVNQRSFAVGELLSARLGVINPGLPGAADFYAGVVEPEGGIAFFTSGGGVTLGRADDPGSFRALAAGVSLTPAFTATAPGFFAYRFAGGEPRGDYTLFLLAVEAGALADGVLADGEILGLAVTPFSFP
jgi:glucose/arabinose dehydrogenase